MVLEPVLIIWRREISAIQGGIIYSQVTSDTDWESSRLYRNDGGSWPEARVGAGGGEDEVRPFTTNKESHVLKLAGTLG